MRRAPPRAKALPRGSLAAEIWRQTHRDYRGIGSTPGVVGLHSVLYNGGARGTCLLWLEGASRADLEMVARQIGIDPARFPDVGPCGFCKHGPMDPECKHNGAK